MGAAGPDVFSAEEDWIAFLTIFGYVFCVAIYVKNNKLLIYICGMSVKRIDALGVCV